MSHCTPKPKCPGCHQEVATSSKAQCVPCKLCSKVKRRVFRFCWDCQREWPQSASSSSSCTLQNCALRAALLSSKRIKDHNSSAFGCPYFRACPRCNALLTHNGQGCPNIECPKCGTEFCFRCLQLSDFCPGTLDSNDSSDEEEFVEGEQSCTIVDNNQSLVSIP
ncbi:E3 ubiquitin-protein ligase ARIH2 [Silurus meridionalis]|uniref:RBR-type E3 ubiquitin transferase n=1 Tax=Silurus meridionalis TaxID=175797 RepID=A0A8T0AC86_SILME|nr:E3 ubiquitin-protein ligase ARIH2 [Silurus meridionalis]KAF7688889.1 hypothetical protein HF521_013696 [Silurus meridionalis]KAI5089515.1 hypothetical protein C0J45_20923 [Silurus meridionalis]